MNIEQYLTPAAVSGVISLLGVVVSALVAKRTAVKTARITTQAEMERLIAEQDYSDKVRHEDRDWGVKDASFAAFEKLAAAVSEYVEKPDRNTKAAAVAACSAMMPCPGSAEGPVKELSRLLRHSDAFIGVDSDTAARLLDQISGSL